MPTPIDVFITGSTGVLGLEVTRLAINLGFRAIVLIRAGTSSEYHLKCRMIQSFAGEGHDLLRFCRGDVVRNKLGLEETEYNKLLETVRHVIHCAGDVQLLSRSGAAIS